MRRLCELFAAIHCLWNHSCVSTCMCKYLLTQFVIICHLVIILLFRNLENVNVPAGIRPQINICLVLFCPWKAHWFILLELARLTTLSPGGGRYPGCSGASAFGKASAWIWPSSHEPPCQWKQGLVKLIYQWKNKRGRAGGGKCTIQRLNKASGHQERLY